jgi:hypothetical protein
VDCKSARAEAKVQAGAQAEAVLPLFEQWLQRRAEREADGRRRVARRRLARQSPVDGGGGGGVGLLAGLKQRHGERQPLHRLTPQRRCCAAPAAEPAAAAQALWPGGDQGREDDAARRDEQLAQRRAHAHRRLSAAPARTARKQPKPRHATPAAHAHAATCTAAGAACEERSDEGLHVAGQRAHHRRLFPPPPVPLPAPVREAGAPEGCAGPRRLPQAAEADDGVGGGGGAEGGAVGGVRETQRPLHG